MAGKVDTVCAELGSGEVAEGAARASAGEGKEKCSSQGSSRNPPLCLPPGTLGAGSLGMVALSTCPTLS